jgi:hypothetical protein
VPVRTALHRRGRVLPAVVIALLVLAPVLAVLHVTEPGRLSQLTEEDGVVEYLQALLYAVTAGAFAVVAWRSARHRAWAALFAVGAFFVAGEEISWGQRILGIGTPASLERSNVQGEINLHNLEGVHGSVRALGVALVLVVFVALPIAHRLVPWARAILDRLAIPVMPLWAVPLAAVALAYMAVPRALDGVVFALDEVGELYLAAAATAYGLGALELTARGRAASGPSDAAAAAPTPLP